MPGSDTENGPKISREDVINASRGTLQKQLYVYFTKPVAGMGPVMENLGDHLKFQVDLEQRGIMLAAGPFFDDTETEWHGEGMIIVRAGSLDEARKIAQSDPMHSSGARTFDIRPWLMNEGSITLKVTFSDGGREVF